MHVDRVRLTGTERELRAENQSPRFPPAEHVGRRRQRAATGRVHHDGSHVPHFPYSPIAVDPKPSAGTKSPAGLVRSSFIIENLDPGSNDTIPPTPKLQCLKTWAP